MAPTDEFRLDGRTAVITGAGSGIGRAIALKFAASGTSVHLLDLNLSQAEAVAHEIENAGGNAKPWLCDVSDHAQTAATFQKIFESARLNILVNNAGIAQIGSIENTSEADFDRILRINVKGYYNCIHASVGHMKANGGGVILNMASVAGSAGLADAADRSYGRAGRSRLAGLIFVFGRGELYHRRGLSD